MPLFLLGLLLGALSGGATYWLTTDSQLAVIVGAIATVATWLGISLLAVVTD